MDIPTRERLFDRRVKRASLRGSDANVRMIIRFNRYIRNGDERAKLERVKASMWHAEPEQLNDGSAVANLRVVRVPDGIAADGLAHLLMGALRAHSEAVAKEKGFASDG